VRCEEGRAHAATLDSPASCSLRSHKLTSPDWPHLEPSQSAPNTRAPSRFDLRVNELEARARSAPGASRIRSEQPFALLRGVGHDDGPPGLWPP